MSIDSNGKTSQKDFTEIKTSSVKSFRTPPLLIPPHARRARLPRGFRRLLDDFSREVLRERPCHINKFGAIYFEGLLEKRKQGTIYSVRHSKRGKFLVWVKFWSGQRRPPPTAAKVRKIATSAICFQTWVKSMPLLSPAKILLRYSQNHAPGLLPYLPILTDSFVGLSIYYEPEFSYIKAQLAHGNRIIVPTVDQNFRGTQTTGSDHYFVPLSDTEETNEAAGKRG